MHTAAREPVPKRRKVRKGAHSCQECRRRKVKCNYATPDSATCVVCERRGAQCISQYESSDLANVTDTTGQDTARSTPVATSEITVTDSRTNDTDLHPFRVPRLSEADHLQDETTTATSTTSMADLTPSSRLLQEHDRHACRIDHRPSLEELPTHADIRGTLLRAFPCDGDITILSERISIVSAICYQSDYKFNGSSFDRTPNKRIAMQSLLEPERHPTLLARQMLLFAAAVQHLSPKDVVPGLAEHQHDIMKRLAESAIKSVNMNDSLLGTLEGLENLIFEFFYHIDCGNIRRAWITSRRAVTAAQMLGLHRAGHRRFARMNDDNDLDPEVMWNTIVSMERMLSLLLGLPSSAGPATKTFKTVASDASLGQNLTALVGSLASKILERNQLESAQQSLDMTDEIDREIILNAERMSSAFWQPLNFVGLETDSLEALTETRRAFGHMCYFSMIVQLHLPFMLRPQDASQRMYSKVACVNAGREILIRQIELRTFDSISARCRMSDFLALVAGMAMMLGHITSHHGNVRDRLLVHQRLGDRATVERALASMDPMAEMRGDVLAVRCAALLKDLLKIEESAAKRHSMRLSHPHDGDENKDEQRDILIIRVPYLGSIQISPEGVVNLPAARTEQVQRLSEGVTIGGIGSMIIDLPHTDSASEVLSTVNSTGLPPTPMSVTHAPMQHHAIHDTPSDSAGMGMEMGMFPATGAGFDDWAFQGVDTAFMEALMRGSAVPLSDGFGDGTWDLSTF